MMRAIRSTVVAVMVVAGLPALASAQPAPRPIALEAIPASAVTRVLVRAEGSRLQTQATGSSAFVAFGFRGLEVALYDVLGRERWRFGSTGTSLGIAATAPPLVRVRFAEAMRSSPVYEAMRTCFELAGRVSLTQGAASHQKTFKLLVSLKRPLPLPARDAAVEVDAATHGVADVSCASLSGLGAQTLWEEMATGRLPR